MFEFVYFFSTLLKSNKAVTINITINIYNEACDRIVIKWNLFRSVVKVLSK